MRNTWYTCMHARTYTHTHTEVQHQLVHILYSRHTNMNIQICIPMDVVHCTYSNSFGLKSFSLIWISAQFFLSNEFTITFWGEKSYKTVYQACAHTTAINHHTHQGCSLPSVSSVYRETSVIIEFYGCDYHRQGLGAAILVHLFPSSPLFLLYGTPLFSSIDLVCGPRPGCEAISTKWLAILTSYISHGIEADPQLRKWADTQTHLDTHKCMRWRCGPNSTKHSGS